MTDGDRFLSHLEELTRLFPAGDTEDDAFRFAALCYAAAHTAAARRVRNEPPLDEALRRHVCGKLFGVYSGLEERMNAAPKGDSSYETTQFVASVLELARSSLLDEESQWIEQYPEFQRTLTRAAHALEARAGESALEALHGEARHGEAMHDAAQGPTESRSSC
jgi:hypothetical protein